MSVKILGTLSKDGYEDRIMTHNSLIVFDLKQGRRWLRERCLISKGDYDGARCILVDRESLIAGKQKLPGSVRYKTRIIHSDTLLFNNILT